MRFAEMAKAAGLPRKPFYLVREVSVATGWPESTVYGSMANGDLRKRLPRGRSGGGWPTSRTSTRGWKGCEE